MALVHVFISADRFSTSDELREFLDKTYTDDGDGIPSVFICEVGLSQYESSCIEAVHSDGPVPLRELLNGVSYSDQFLPLIDGDLLANVAICVFAPNRIHAPERSSLTYLGAYPYGAS